MHGYLLVYCRSQFETTYSCTPASSLFRRALWLYTKLCLFRARPRPPARQRKRFDDDVQRAVAVFLLTLAECISQRRPQQEFRCKLIILARFNATHVVVNCVTVRAAGKREHRRPVIACYATDPFVWHTEQLLTIRVGKLSMLLVEIRIRKVIAWTNRPKERSLAEDVSCPRLLALKTEWTILQSLFLCSKFFSFRKFALETVNFKNFCYSYVVCVCLFGQLEISGLVFIWIICLLWLFIVSGALGMVYCRQL